MASCSAERERTGASAAALTISTNAQVVGFNEHYASTVAAVNPSTGTWHWVTAYDTCSWATPASGDLQCDAWTNTHTSSGLLGWSVSSDLTGSSWTANVPPPGAEESMWPLFGPPSQGGTFTGWAGDATLALIGNPPSGSQIIMASAVTSDVSGLSDIGSLVSTDGGSSWGMPQVVSAQHTGGNADQPQVITNQSAPYSTFVTWTSFAHSPQDVAYFTSINNVTLTPGSSSSAPNTWDAGSPTGPARTPKLLMNAPQNEAIRPKMAVSTIAWTGPGCTGGPHEIVFFAWSDFKQGRVCGTGIDPGPGPVNWYLTAFDNTANQWLLDANGIPLQIQIDHDPSWPTCIGSQHVNLLNVDLAEARLVALGNYIAVVHNQSTPEGTRIRESVWSISCNNNQLAAPTLITNNQSPSWCYRAFGSGYCTSADGGQPGGNGYDGGVVVNDQWGPTIALLPSTPPKVLITWYDTAGDDTNGNVRIVGALNATSITANPFMNGSTPNEVFISVPTGSQTVPWTITAAPWYDYQDLAPDYLAHTGSGTFMATWGGDARQVSANAPSGVWAARVTP